MTRALPAATANLGRPQEPAPRAIGCRRRQPVNIARGADLFIAEAYFYEKKIKFHLNYQTLLEKKAELDCKRIILTHMSDDVLCRLDSLELEYAEDGKEIIL